MKFLANVSPKTITNVVGGVVLVGSGCFVLLGSLQAAMAWWLFPRGVTPGELADPGLFGYMLRYFPFFVTAFVGFWAFVLSSAYGVIKRQEWARSTLVWLMRLGALALAVMILFAITSPMAPQDAPEIVKYGVMAIIAITLFGLLYAASMLASRPVRRYFSSTE
jgi:hypothetical protein